MEDTTVTSSSHHESSAKPIAPFRLALTLLGPLILILISRHLELGLERKVFLGIFRSSVQLLFLGFVLLGFIFSLHNPFVVFTYLTMMLLIAALEATGRQVRTYKGHYLDCLISSVVGGGFVGIYGSAVIFHPNPWWSPAVLIPTSGMIIGNSVSGPAVAVERLLSEIADKKHEAETRLAFGASDYESVLGIVKASISAALIPTMNQMAIMGLVSIPGMMTGQLIGGTSPAVAAEYQMAILYLLVTTATISSFTSVLLAVRHAVFDREHRLTPEKLIKSGKVEIDQAIYRLVLQSGQFVYHQLLCCETIRPYLSSSLSSSNNSIHSSTSNTSTSTSSLFPTSLTSYSPLMSDVSQHIHTNSNDSGAALEMTHQRAMFTIHDENEDVEHNDNTHDVSVPRCEQQLFVSHIAEDGLEARVTYTIQVNTPVYVPFAVTANGGVNKHQYPFFALHQVNVRSGNGKLFGGISKDNHLQTGNLSLCMSRGERITLEGPSGMGKTRLLRALAELDPLYQGYVSFLGHSTQKLCLPGDVGKTHSWYSPSSSDNSSYHTSPNNKGSITWKMEIVSVPTWRTRVIYVPQALPPMAGTPTSLLKECLNYRARRSSPGVKAILAELETQCRRLEVSLGLRDHMLSQAWNTLSGGERQRAAISCALILATSMPAWELQLQGASSETSAEASPVYHQREVQHFPDTLLLLDEPTAACDTETTLLVERALVASGAAMVCITHDERQAQRIAHRRILLQPLTPTSDNETLNHNNV